MSDPTGRGGTPPGLTFSGSAATPPPPPPPPVAPAPRSRGRGPAAVVVVIVVVVLLLAGALVAVFAVASRSSTTTSNSSTTSVAALQSVANKIAENAGCPANPLATVNTLSWHHAPPMTVDTARDYYATFTTTAGTFVARLDTALAPVTVNNFVFLALHKYYNCTSFFRVIPGFMIQGGAPEQNDADSTQPGYTIPDEFQKHPGAQTFPDLSLAMANTGQPHSGGSQFFIVTGTVGENLPNTYTLFGQVITGRAVPTIIQDFGNSNQVDNGIPPVVTERILTVTISTTAP